MDISNKPSQEWSQESVLETERMRVSRRRTALGIKHTANGEGGAIGLALSGGGIRSATFSLGFMRGLAQARVLESFDYISTVSGGGYAGAFFNSLFARRKAKDRPPDERPAMMTESARAKEAYDTLRGPICRPGGESKSGWSLWWLRNSGRYLAPTGAGDYLYAAAMGFRNLLAVHYVLGLTLLIGSIFAIIFDFQLRSILNPVVPFPTYSMTPGGGIVLVGVGFFLVSVLPLGLAFFLAEMPKSTNDDSQDHTWWRTRTWKNTFAGSIASALIGVALLASMQIGNLAKMPWPIQELRKWISEVVSTSVTPIAPAMFAISALTFIALCYLEQAAKFVENDMHLPDGSKGLKDKSPQGKMASTRVVLTKRLATSLKILLLTISAGALVYVGHWFAKNGTGALATALASGSALIAVIKKVSGILTVPAGTGKKASISFEYIALVMGFSLALILAVAWMSTAWYAIAELESWNQLEVMPLTVNLIPLILAMVVLTTLAFVMGGSFQFLNLSTIQSLYASRLTRAYLGASNPARADGLDTRWIRISDAHPDDNLSLTQYFATENVAPVHLINVTLNETVSPTDPLVQRDRHGRSICVCPEHICVDGVWTRRIEHDSVQVESSQPHAVIGKVCGVFSKRKAEDKDGREPVSRSQFDALPESMSLGSWIGISGAAFSTGIGRGTSIGKSLLLGIANVRLGHWWRCGHLERTDAPSSWSDKLLRKAASLFQTQSYLAAELLGRFSGRYAPYWYLSDGGHFDNTGVYELLRRRLGVIVCSDNGADPPNDAWKVRDHYFTPMTHDN